MSNEDFARDPNTPPEALAMLSTSPSAAVRRLVALNLSTPVPALRFLAADEDRAVREAAAGNPRTPEDAFAEAPPAPAPVILNPEIVPAAFIPASEVHQSPSLWQRLLALLGRR